ncbi:MAG: beta strand repeat-containing protein [Planctomycetia bacterium]
MKKQSFAVRIVLGSLCAFVTLTAFTAHAQTTYTWDGGGSDNNWSTGANWIGGVAPARGSSTFVTFAGSTRLTPFNDQGDWAQLAGMTFASGASGFRIEGNGNIGFVNGSGEQVINQNSATSQEINVGFSFGTNQNSRINLNAGDLVISSPNFWIDSAASVRNLTVTGSDSTRRTVTFAGNVNKGGTAADPDMYIQSNKRALVTGALTFGAGDDGSVFIDDGVLQFSGAGTMTGGRPVIGNTSGSGNAAVWLDTPGATFARQLELRNGSSGRRTIGGLNTSGTVTFSNTLMQTSSAPDFDLAAATGGTVVFSGQRTATGVLNVNRADGATAYGGTVELSNNDAVGSTSTVVHAGTLRLNQTAGNGWGVVRGAVTLNPGATLALTGNNAALGWESAGRVTSLSLGEGSLVNSNTQHVWLGGGSVTLTGATMQTNGGVSTSTGDYFEWGDSPVTTNASAASSQIAGRIRLRGDGLVNRILAFTVADGAAATDLLVTAAITESQDGGNQGNAGIAKFGAGTMKLTGVNSYTNATKLHAGVLEVTDFAQLGTGEFEFDAASGDSGTLRYAGGSTTTTKTLWIDNGGITRAAIDVSEAGTTLTWNPGAGTRNQNLTKTGAGSLVFGGVVSGTATVGVEGGTLVLTGANSYSGGTIVSGGTVEVSGGGAAGGSAAGLGTGNVSIASGAQVTYWLSESSSHTIANAFSLSGGTLHTADGLNTFSGPVTLGSGASTISARWEDAITLSGGLTGSGNVLFTQGGGGTDKAAPTFVLSGVGSNTGTVRVSGSSGGAATKLQLANVNALQSATLDLATADVGAVEFTVAGNNTYALGGLQGTRNLAFGANSLSVGGNGQSTTYSGVLSGNGGLTKVGSGRLFLTGANIFTGTTSVIDGDLRLNGSIAGSLNVALVASLSGTGTVGGNATIIGTHSPGNSPGAQTFNGNLTYQAGAVVNWELIANTSGSAGTDYDQIILPTGDLNFAGSTTLALSFTAAGSSVNWANAFWNVNRSWMVYDLAGGTLNNLGNLALGGSLLDSLNQPLSPTERGYFTISNSGQDVMLNFVAVPEPATWALAVIGGALALLRRRRAARG